MLLQTHGKPDRPGAGKSGRALTLNGQHAPLPAPNKFPDITVQRLSSFTLYSPFGVIILALTSVNKATVRSSSRRLQIRQRAFGRGSNFTSQYVRRFRKVNLGWR